MNHQLYFRKNKEFRKWLTIKKIPQKKNKFYNPKPKKYVYQNKVKSLKLQKKLKNYWNYLPSEIKLMIFEFLDSMSQINLISSCRENLEFIKFV